MSASRPAIPSPTDEARLEGAFTLLADMTDEFAGSQDIAKTLERALGRIVAHVGAEAGSLWLLEDEDRKLCCRASVGPNPITGLRIDSDKGVIGQTIGENRTQAVLDVSSDPRFTGEVDQKSGFQTRSILSAPMSVKGRPLGAIQVVNKRTGDGRFAENDVHLLDVLASSAALAISNARMAASLVEAERARRELELAAEIQRSLLPEAGSDDSPVFGMNVPARTVSGDFFDFLPLEDREGCLAFCLGDVSGKGMNAALLMAKTASLYRCLSRRLARPGELLRTLNDEICDTATRGMFVTMVAGVLEPATGRVRLASAGHEPALFHEAGGGFTSVPAEAPPLGILPDTEFPEAELALHGGTLYLFSDGLTEACAEGQQLGAKGVMALVERFAAAPLAERVRGIVDHARERLELRDDLTLLAVSDRPAGA